MAAEPSAQPILPPDRLTRPLLWLLGLLELAVGAIALLGAIQIFRASNAGMALIFAPVLAIFALLLVAGAAIFIRRPWARHLHSAALLLLGALLTVYVGPMLGPIGWLQVAAAALLVVGPLLAIFRLAAVRRYFGVS